jgi:hypothetical protein
LKSIYWTDVRKSPTRFTLVETTALMEVMAALLTDVRALTAAV